MSSMININHLFFPLEQRYSIDESMISIDHLFCSFSYIVMRIILVWFMTHVNRVWVVDDMNRMYVCG